MQSLARLTIAVLLLSAGAASAQSCDDDVQWASEDLVHYADEFSETVYDHDGDSWLYDSALAFADDDVK